MIMHYTSAQVIALAKDIGGGYKRAIVTIGGEDTIDVPTSTKWFLRGPANVQWLIHPSGITVDHQGGHRTYTRSE